MPFYKLTSSYKLLHDAIKICPWCPRQCLYTSPSFKRKLWS